MSFPRKLGLRAKLMLLLASMLAVTLAFGVLEFARDRAHARQKLEGDLARIAQVLAAGQTSRLNRLSDFLEAIAHYPRVIGQRWSECDAVLAGLPLQVEDFLEVGIVSRDGHVLAASTPATPSFVVANDTWFQRASESGHAAIGDYEPGPLTGVAGISLVQPIPAPDGSPAAFVFATTSSEPISSALREARLPDGGALNVFDQTGTIVAREPDSRLWLGHSVSEMPAMQRVLQQHAGIITEGAGIDDVTRVFACCEIAHEPDGAGLYLTAGLPVEAALADVDGRYLEYLIAFVVLGGALLGGAWFFGGRVLARRTDALLDAARRIENGDPSARTGLAGDGDELARVAAAFDLMAATLEARTRERESAEQSLRDSDERFRLLADGVRDHAIHLLDPHGRVTSWNTGAEQLLGWKADEVLGRSFEHLYTSDAIAADVPKRALERAVREGHFGEEGLRQRKNGSLFWAGETMTALRDADGRLRGFSRLTHDLTAQRDREQALRESEARVRELNQELEDRVAARTAELQAALKELEAFSYSVSHDMRTPLRHINGYVNLLGAHCDGQLDDKAQRYMKTIVEASTRMGQLIDDILAFSRVSRVEARSVHVRMQEIARATWDELLADAPGRDIRFTLEDLPEVEGDPALLRQAMANLLDNAIKYTRGRTHAHVHVGHQRAAEEDVFFVRDDGVGFDMQHAGKLFGVFERLHDPADFEGTGIGLAIVHRVITRHNGRVWAESTPAEGATFFFSIPRPVACP